MIAPPKGCPRAWRAMVKTVPGHYHWARRNEVSGCRLMRDGDVSTDAYPWLVNCPRCRKLPSRLKALAALKGLLGTKRTRAAHRLAGHCLARG